MISITETLLGFPGDQSFVSFLVLATIKGSILLLLVLSVTKIFSTFSSATKHFIWTATFLILFMLPITNMILPSWEVPVTRSNSEELTIHTRQDTNIEEEISSGTREDRVSENTPYQQQIDNSEKLSSGETAEGESLINTLYSSTITFGKSLTNNNRFMSVLFVIWLSGIVVLFLKRIMAHMTIYRIYKNSADLDDDEWNAIFLDIMATYKISRSVKLLKNDEVKSPMTWGWIQPKIIIPSEMEAWTKERKRYILLHELAHVKRMDLATQYMADLVCMIHWFNPLVWISNKKMLNECEHACDDYVLERCENPSSYADLLLEVASSSLKWNYELPVVISMANKNHLERRLLSILNKNTGRAEITLSTACTTLFGISLLAMPLIMFSPSDESAEKQVQFGEVNSLFLKVPDLSLVDENQGSEILPSSEQPEQIGIQDTSTVAALTDILYDDDKDLRMQAVEALGKIGTATAVNAVINSIRRHKWEDLDDVVNIFSSLRDSLPIQSLMDSIMDEKRDIRREAIFHLNDAPNVNAINPLCDYMEDEDSIIREETAKGLGRIGVSDVLPCLIPHIKDENQEVRVEVIEAIGNIQDKKAVSALSEALLKDESSDVREEAADALGAIGDPLAIEPLSMALYDESSDVREEAAEALGKIGDPSALEFLTNALKQESDNEVRREIMNSIGEIYSSLD